MRVDNDKIVKMRGWALCLSDFICASFIFLAEFSDGPLPYKTSDRVYVDAAYSSVFRRTLKQEARGD